MHVPRAEFFIFVFLIYIEFLLIVECSLASTALGDVTPTAMSGCSTREAGNVSATFSSPFLETR